MKKHLQKFIHHYFKNKTYFFVFCLLLAVLLITRFYDTEGKSVFGYDQVDNAWAAKNIIVDGNFPLVGMQAKGNTGFFIGPYYYYFITPFYFASNLDPAVSGIIAGVTALFTFLVIYFVVRSLFGERAALFAVFIDVFSYYILQLDRVQWPVNFIVPLSFLIFFSLYKIYLKDNKYFLLLTISIGFSLHIHFTSIFYFLFLILSIPFISWKKSVKYILYSLPILLFFVFPIVLNYITSSSGGNAANYLGSSFHGLHLRRLIQIIGDGFVEFNAILKVPYALAISLLAMSTYIYLLLRKATKAKIVTVYLSILWVLIPWIAFSTYSGEITNYYFGVSRTVAIIVFAYLLNAVFSIDKVVVKLIVILVLGIYGIANISEFAKHKPVSLRHHKQEVEKKILKGEKIEFQHGDPQSYLYYIYKERKQ